MCDARKTRVGPEWDEEGAWERERKRVRDADDIFANIVIRQYTQYENLQKKFISIIYIYCTNVCQIFNVKFNGRHVKCACVHVCCVCGVYGVYKYACAVCVCALERRERRMCVAKVIAFRHRRCVVVCCACHCMPPKWKFKIPCYCWLTNSTADSNQYWMLPISWINPTEVSNISKFNRIPQILHFTWFIFRYMNI